MGPITGFVEECCLLARNARTPALVLYLNYVYWCLEHGVPVQDQFTFLDVLACYGLKYRERKKGAWVRGIAVLPRFRVAE
jgi:Poxvirus D5 protein-like